MSLLVLTHITDCVWIITIHLIITHNNYKKYEGEIYAYNFLSCKASTRQSANDFGQTAVLASITSCGIKDKRLTIHRGLHTLHAISRLHNHKEVS
jgi:hypothetical protein